MNYVELNNGIKMPILGFGVFQIADQNECERCVLDAIEAGNRLIDTAQAYGNEEAVGKAVNKCGVPRDELFITTKVWITNAGYEKAKASIEESLKKLQMEYLDLVLIHQPFNDYYGTYRAMEDMYKAGKIKAIAQVALRYLIQKGVSVLPKSVSKARMLQNIDVFDFELTSEDMELIATLDKAESLFFSHYDPQNEETHFEQNFLLIKNSLYFCNAKLKEVESMDFKGNIKHLKFTSGCNSNFIISPNNEKISWIIESEKKDKVNYSVIVSDISRSNMKKVYEKEYDSLAQFILFRWSKDNTNIFFGKRFYGIGGAIVFEFAENLYKFNTDSKKMEFIFGKERTYDDSDYISALSDDERSIAYFQKKSNGINLIIYDIT